MTSAYQRYLAVWPEQRPAISEQEVRAAVLKLHKMATGQPTNPKWLKLQVWVKWSGRFTSAGRDGWPHFVWYAGHAFCPKDKEPVAFCAYLAREVLERGWLEGKLQRVPRIKTRPSIQDQRAERVLELIVKWERKEKLAKTKLKKLRERRAYYEQALMRRARRTNVAEFIMEQREGVST